MPEADKSNKTEAEQSNTKPNWDREKADLGRNGSQPLVPVPQAPSMSKQWTSKEEQDAFLRKVGMIP